MIDRILNKSVENTLFTGKSIILLGSRQTGKTTLLQSIASSLKRRILFLDCDEPDIREMLSEKTSTELKTLIGENEVVMIDEAQRIRNIGITLKLITDKIKKVQLIVTGSSALELANEINEPLTGRKWEFTLYPLSVLEMVNHHGQLEEKRMLNTRLIYGMYPDVITHPGKEKTILKQLTDSYLYKDIFSLKEIRKPEIVEKLLQALSLQVGSEVSYNELADTTKSDPATVSRYIELLEKCFVIFRLPSFSRNVRNELKKSRKIYFFDNGIRNAILANFQIPELRNDIGALWENFLISERVKFTAYKEIWANHYFWRTKQQQEIDYIEERDGKLFAYEFKWKPKSTARISKTFTNAYPESNFEVITTENYLSFLS